MAIQGEALNDLAVEYSQKDLSWHYQLTQKRDSSIDCAREYLEWAEQWLQQLKQANHRKKRYSPLAFKRVLGLTWAIACWHYRDRDEARFPLRMFRSSLSRGIPGNLQASFIVGAIRHRSRPVFLDSSVPAEQGLKIQS